MQELQRHWQLSFSLVFLVMDPGYKEEKKEEIIKNAELLQIPIQMVPSNIFSVVTSQTDGNPCYLCARMRRGFLYDTARKLGCNKIALGHHFDDVIETTLLNVFYAGEFKTMLPKLHSTNFENSELIRPMYLIKEKNILSWARYNDLHFLNCACKFTEDIKHSKESLSKRKEMKSLIETMRKEIKDVDLHIFKAAENINMDAVLGYRKNGEKHSFLEEYDQK